MSFIHHRRATSPNKFECRNVYSTNRIDVATSALPKLASGKIDTVADVLVREVELSEVSRNDVILFHRCGA